MYIFLPTFCSWLYPSPRKLGETSFTLTPGNVSLLSCTGPQLTEWDPLTIWRTISFTQSADSNVGFIHKHLHRHIQYYAWINIRAPHGRDKLVHKIDHHRYPSILVPKFVWIYWKDMLFIVCLIDSTNKNSWVTIMCRAIHCPIFCTKFWLLRERLFSFTT